MNKAALPHSTFHPQQAALVSLRQRYREFRDDGALPGRGRRPARRKRDSDIKTMGVVLTHSMSMDLEQPKNNRSRSSTPRPGGNGTPVEG
jgi:hypothetical protein